MKKQILAICIGAALSTPAIAQAQNDGEVTATQLQEVMQQMQRLQQRVAELEAQLAAQQEQDEDVVEEVALEQSPRAEDVAPRKRINSNTALEARVEQLEGDIEAAQNAPITIGGAVRTQFVWEDYNDGNKDRGGDIDFDLIRLDYSGTIGDVILSAQYRWFQYMESVQHAWVGYNFTDNWQGTSRYHQGSFGNTLIIPTIISLVQTSMWVLKTTMMLV